MKISLKSFWPRGAGVDAPAPEGAAQALMGGTDPDSARAGYEEALRGLAGQPGESLALSVRVPFCAAHCLFCERRIHAAQPLAVIDHYLQALASEAVLLSEHIGRDRDVLQLHLGGGSANELTEGQLVRLVDALNAAWRLPADAEMSAEADPRRVSRRQLELLRALGFRQVTFGVIDLDAAVQRAIGRCHTQALVEDVCSAARGADFEHIQLDLMIGLPLQSPQGWQATLDRVIAMAPDRVALRRYRHRPDQVPGQHAIEREQLPDDAVSAELQALAGAALQGAGYLPIGRWLFVLDDDDLPRAQAEGRLRRNLIGFTASPAAPLLGLGTGAVGQIGSSLYWNHAALADWQATVQSRRLPVAGHRRAAAPGAD